MFFEVGWLCNGMNDEQKTTLKSQYKVWSIKHTIESKSTCVFTDKSSGRYIFFWEVLMILFLTSKKEIVEASFLRIFSHQFSNIDSNHVWWGWILLHQDSSFSVDCESNVTCDWWGPNAFVFRFCVDRSRHEKELRLWKNVGTSWSH